jgi:hypothetical protein
LQGRPLPTSNDPEARTRESALLEDTGGKSLRTDRYRYVLRAGGQEQLYDLEATHGQYEDISDEEQYAETLSEMRGELARRMLEMERPLPRTWPY